MGFLFEIETDNIVKNKNLNCNVCSLNKHELSKMEATGSDNPILYFCGEAPGETEVMTGVQFTGVSGKRLRKTLLDIVDEEFIDKYIRWNNVVRCRPPNNRTPTKYEIDCCSGYLMKDIEKTKPVVVVAFGSVATELFIDMNDLFLLTGRFFLAKYGDTTFYVYPMYHPSFLIRQNDKEKLYNSFFDACFYNLFERLENLEPPEIEKNVFSGIVVLNREDDVVNYFSKFGNIVSLDIETTGLRSFDGHSIVSVAISDGVDTIAFPFTNRIKNELIKFIRNKQVIVHNLGFELEWLYYIYNNSVFDSIWHDTMVQAYILDFRKSNKYAKNRGSFGLDFLVFQHFGFNLKALSPEIDRKGISKFDELTGKYNALDAKYTFKLFNKQKKLMNNNQIELYNKTIDVQKSVILCQSNGVNFDEELCGNLHNKFSNYLQNIESQILSLSYIKSFEEKYKTAFDIMSPKHIARVFTELGIDLKRTDKGNFSTDEEELTILSNNGNELATQILEYRKFYKLKSTYLENALKLNNNGKLYPRYNICFTATGRLSSSTREGSSSGETLNFQNFPKNEVKNIIKCPEDHVFMACDYSQLEVRVVAMLSQDKFLCQDILNGVDIHKNVANKFIELYNRLVNVDFDEFRGFVKSALVFGSIYGSSEISVAKRFKVEYDVPENVTLDIFYWFWERYYGLKKWQEDLIKFYKKNGYIESPTGRKWFAPLSVRQIINYIIQSVAAFDICAMAGVRLSKKAIKEDKPWLQFIMNVHDDLSFYIPEDKVEEAVEDIATEMTRKVYPWQTLPLKVKISIGYRWGELKTFCEASLNNNKLEVTT